MLRLSAPFLSRIMVVVWMWLVSASASTSASYLGCDVNLPSDTAIWRPNQTQDLLLPSVDTSGQLGWEGSVHMQSGDILLVRINDTELTNKTTPHSTSLSTDNSTGSNSSTIPDEQVEVYASRTGRAPCDVSEGVLLDITPLTIDGLKVITLYDKDLGDGLNFLIVMSEAWSRCVQLRVSVKSDNCGDNQDCSSKGLCYSNASMDGYECQCCPGFIGLHCEEQDACYPSPCQNHGICVDISQGHDGSTFQCLCPYGFTGKVCEDTSDPCESSPCQHGGQCQPSNLTASQFRCQCPADFTGSLCQHSLDQCASSPCQHGICVDQRGGYRCYCQPGYAGDQCQYEYNECESSPCLHGGTCTDHVGSYSCACGRGYSGTRCEQKVDLCDPNPCLHHRVCEDKGNTYVCECPKGFIGTDCLQPRRAACSANPCHNGGTCWSSVDSFYCACRPGYTGKICNEEVIVEVIPSAASQLDVNGNNQPMDFQMPISIHLDHLHNVYVAVGTLACALLIVVLTQLDEIPDISNTEAGILLYNQFEGSKVAACHCRIHETYKHCFTRGSPLISCNIKRFDNSPKPNRMEVDKEHLQPLASAARNYPHLDNSEMYYALDFSDSQSSPLIQ